MSQIQSLKKNMKYNEKLQVGLVVSMRRCINVLFNTFNDASHSSLCFDGIGKVGVVQAPASGPKSHSARSIPPPPLAHYTCDAVPTGVL